MNVVDQRQGSLEFFATEQTLREASDAILLAGLARMHGKRLVEDSRPQACLSASPASDRAGDIRASSAGRDASTANPMLSPDHIFTP